MKLMENLVGELKRQLWIFHLDIINRASELIQTRTDQVKDEKGSAPSADFYGPQILTCCCTYILLNAFPIRYVTLNSHLNVNNIRISNILKGKCIKGDIPA